VSQIQSHAFLIEIGTQHFVDGRNRGIFLYCQSIAYGEHERNFQTYRRGRYVEFNLGNKRNSRRTWL
jgi:coproporphyrinogen III oxidase